MNRAAVAIPEKLFFKIGEVCDITGVQAHVLRYWESEFPMLAPQKNRAGQRTYRKRDVEMALRIKELLYEDQYTIAGAKKKLLSELRGASKLKVVTPETSQATAPQLVSTAAPPAAQENAGATPQGSTAYQATAAATATAAQTALVSGEQREALRSLAYQLRDLLHTLEVADANRRPPER